MLLQVSGLEVGCVRKLGLDLVKHFEGLRLSPYLCSAGVATIGYGSTRYFGRERVSLGDVNISEGMADLMLQYDYLVRESWVKSVVKVDLTGNELAALTSWVFNVGRGNASKSTLLRKLNKGDYEGAALEFPKWRKAGGRVLNGLVRRRAMEQKLFIGERNE